MKILIYKEQLTWNGTVYDSRFYQSDGIDTLSPITQVQAVPFVDNNHIVLYKHKDGYYGLPGGKIEENESYEKALARELSEEASCTLLSSGLIGYIESIREDDQYTEYQLRYWALVESRDEPVSDPCGKAVGKEVFEIQDAITKLNWGVQGEIIINTAHENMLLKKAV